MPTHSTCFLVHNMENVLGLHRPSIAQQTCMPRIYELHCHSMMQNISRPPPPHAISRNASVPISSGWNGFSWGRYVPKVLAVWLFSSPLITIQTEVFLGWSLSSSIFLQKPAGSVLLIGNSLQKDRYILQLWTTLCEIDEQLNLLSTSTVQYEILHMRENQMQQTNL